MSQNVYHYLYPSLFEGIIYSDGDCDDDFRYFNPDPTFSGFSKKFFQNFHSTLKYLLG